MDTSHTHPKLRWPIDIRQETFQSKDVLVFTCPLGITREPLVLVAAVGPILASFEGTLSVDEIVSRFKQYGVNRELVQELIKLLDDSLFLQSPKFYEAEKKIREGFQNSTTREAYLSGLGYSSTPDALALELDSYFEGNEISLDGSKSLLCLVSPHIDYRRGGSTYGAAYKALKGEDHDVYIVIGTSHQYSSNLFHLTKKDFQSPFGPAKCDTLFVESLANGYGASRAYADEFLHKREHSLELQIPFLLHVKRTANIVPILVGSFYNMLRAGKLPNEYEEYDSFVSSLEQITRSRIRDGGKVCFIAGVDMAHVGSAFGDEKKLTDEFLSDVEKRDQEYLRALGDRDKKRLFTHMAEDMDSRRICGFPTMYTLLDLFERLDFIYDFSLFRYEQATDFVSDRSVTFAGAAMYRKEVEKQRILRGSLIDEPIKI